jgi:tetratricopeptide (TPR) repeat protein
MNNRGFIRLMNGELDEAREDIDQSIALDPENAWAYRNKGRWYHVNGLYEDALRLYALALTKDTFIQNIFIYRGDTYMEMGEKELACKEYKKAMENNNRLATARLASCE